MIWIRVGLRLESDERSSRLRTESKESKEMKVQASIQGRCKFCKIVKREGILYVICSRDPRHKQRQG